MANFLLPLLTTVASRVKDNFIQKTRQTSAVQEQFLRNLLFAYQNTELGRTYKIGEINSIDGFQSRIPVLPYSSYEPYTERIAKGEQNILTSEAVVYLNLTSGSTSKKS